MVISEKQDGKTGAPAAADEVDAEPVCISLRDIPGIVIAAGILVVAATFFSWLLFRS